MDKLSPDNWLGALGLLGLLLWVAVDMPPAIERRGRQVTLCYARWVRLFYLFSTFAVPLGITLVGIAQKPRDASEMRAFIGVYALFAVITVPMWWVTLRFAVTITDEGLLFRSPWRLSRFVPWDDIAELRFSDFMHWYVLRTSSGYVFRIPDQCVPGLGQLLEAVAKHRKQA